MINASVRKSALGFAELSEDEREQKIMNAAKICYLDKVLREAYEFFTIVDFMTVMFSIGRFTEFDNLSDSKKDDYIHSFSIGYEVETFFLLNDLKPDVKRVSFNMARHGTFEVFDKNFDEKYASMFTDLGSINFRNAICQYFRKYGAGSKIDKSGRYYIDLGREDSFMGLACLVLLQVYGEEKVLKILNRITKEDFLSARDFILLVMSENDYTEYPLVWVAQIIGDSA